MEAAVAFQTACSAFQLAHLCCNIVQTAHQMHTSADGLTKDNTWIQEQSKRLNEASSSVSTDLNYLQSQQSQLSGDQKRLIVVSDDCIKLSKELGNVLDQLRVDSAKGKVHLLNKLKNNYSRKAQVAKLRERLVARQRQLNTELLIVLSKDVDMSKESHRRVLEQLNVQAVKQTDAFTGFSQSLKDGLENVGDVPTKVNQHASATLDAMSKRNHDRELTQRLIDQLKYPGIFERESVLREAYDGTFEWIFEENSQVPEFFRWLQSEDHVFWINGKPGSGKSTLMKLIADREETRSRLDKWAGQKKLIILRFFFWKAGQRAEQHTLSGALRSLLFQLLCIRPSFLENCLPYLFPDLASSSEPHVAQPTIRVDPRRLYDALNATITRFLEQYKIYFLIDGLDELYDESHDYESLLQYLKTLVHRSGVKALVSSRPEPCFLESFEHYPNIKLQELTAHDIHHYAWGTLSKNPRMQVYLQKEWHRSNSLIRDAVDKADGVFLWIRIAVSELLDGLRKMNSLDDLETRLDGMAPTLHGLFKEQVLKISPVDRQRAKVILRLIMDQPLSVYQAAFATGCCEVPFTSLVDHQSQDTRDLAQRFEVRLREMENICLTQCAGLVDVTEGEVEPLSSPQSALAHEFDATVQCKALVDVNFVATTWFFRRRFVGLIHRSAYDFLREDEAAQDLLTISPTSKHDFYHYKCLALWGELAFWLHLLPWYLETFREEGSWFDDEYNAEFDASWRFIASVEKQCSNTQCTSDALRAASQHMPRSLGFAYKSYRSVFPHEAALRKSIVIRGSNYPLETFLAGCASCFHADNFMLEQIECAEGSLRGDIVRTCVWESLRSICFDPWLYYDGQSGNDDCLITLNELLSVGADVNMLIPNCWTTCIFSCGGTEPLFPGGVFNLVDSQDYTAWQIFLIQCFMCRRLTVRGLGRCCLSSALLSETLRHFIRCGADLRCSVSFYSRIDEGLYRICVSCSPSYLIKGIVDTFAMHLAPDITHTLKRSEEQPDVRIINLSLAGYHYSDDVISSDTSNHMSNAERNETQPIYVVVRLYPQYNVSTYDDSASLADTFKSLINHLDDQGNYKYAGIDDMLSSMKRSCNTIYFPGIGGKVGFDELCSWRTLDNDEDGFNEKEREKLREEYGPCDWQVVDDLKVIDPNHSHITLIKSPWTHLPFLCMLRGSYRVARKT